VSLGLTFKSRKWLRFLSLERQEFQIQVVSIPALGLTDLDLQTGLYSLVSRDRLY